MNQLKSNLLGEVSIKQGRHSEKKSEMKYSPVEKIVLVKKGFYRNNIKQSIRSSYK